MADDGDKYGAVPDTPELKPEAIWPWLIAVAVFAGLGTVGLTLWVYLTNEKPSDAAELIRTFSPLFLGAGAAVTFMTVLWRGAINQQQAHQAERQNDSKDEVELGLLLDKASEYLEGLTDADSDSRSFVGLSMLETVALAPNDKYAVSALEILLRSYKAIFEKGSAFREKADSCIEGAANKDRYASTNLNWELFDRPQHPAMPYLDLPLGFPASSLENANLDALHLARAMAFTQAKQPQKYLRWRIKGCNIRGVHSDHGFEQKSYGLIVGRNFTQCTFDGLLINEFRAVPAASTFESCDFSGAIVDLGSLDEKNNTTFQDCFFDPRKPIKFIATRRFTLDPNEEWLKMVKEWFFEQVKPLRVN